MKTISADKKPETKYNSVVEDIMISLKKYSKKNKNNIKKDYIIGRNL